MTSRVRLLVLLFATPLAACAASPRIVPGKWLEVTAHALRPYDVHEECTKLAAGDVLHYRFTTKAPVAFNIHYHEGKAVVQPVTRDNVTRDEGQFKASVPQEYCLMWEAGAAGTPLDYGVRLMRGSR